MKNAKRNKILRGVIPQYFLHLIKIAREKRKIQRVRLSFHKLYKARKRLAKIRKERIALEKSVGRDKSEIQTRA